MNRRNCLATILILLGLLLLLVAGGLLLLGRSVPFLGSPAPQPPSPPAPPLPATHTPAPAPPIALGPTAAAVATQLPRPTPIPTVGAGSTRPAAPARIVIPAIGVDAPVVEVGWHVAEVDGEARGVWETVAGAVGHHRGSADPGQPGNCVLSAHSSDAGSAVFRRLDELAISNRIAIYKSDGVVYNYAVTAVLKLDEVGATEAEKREHARWLDPTDEPVLTLVTCWPPWSYTHRVVVRAELRIED